MGDDAKLGMHDFIFRKGARRRDTVLRMCTDAKAFKGRAPRAHVLSCVKPVR